MKKDEWKIACSFETSREAVRERILEILAQKK